MVRPPMFSRCVSVRYGQADSDPLPLPPAGIRRPTAGGIAALVALTAVVLVLAALVGVVAGLSPALAAAEGPDGADTPAVSETTSETGQAVSMAGLYLLCALALQLRALRRSRRGLCSSDASGMQAQQKRQRA